jgi:hypothetical protein
MQTIHSSEMPVKLIPHYASRLIVLAACSVYSFALKTEAIFSSETSITLQSGFKAAIVSGMFSPQIDKLSFGMGWAEDARSQQ